jgi:predicted phage tail protein
MKVTISFHKSLLSYTNDTREVTFDVVTYSQLISALEASFPKLRKVIKQIKNSKNTDNFGLIDLVSEKVLTSLDYFRKKVSSNRLFLVPLVAGSKNQNLTTALIGIALITVAIMNPAFAAPLLEMAVGATTVGGMVFGAGVSMLIGAVVAEIMKPPKPDNTPDGPVRENDQFGSLQHTTASGTTIPLVYGRHRVAGQFLSGEIRTLEKSPDKSSADILKELFEGKVL